jgi:hypothetical protein
MPKISKESAPHVEDSGPALDISGPLDDYTVDFVEIRQEQSLAGLLQGLPGNSCPCPHWGYLFAGRITVTYADRVESYRAGDAFLMSPGHVPAAEAGTQFVQFSPTDQMKQVRAHMTATARAMQGAQSAP